MNRRITFVLSAMTALATAVLTGVDGSVAAGSTVAVFDNASFVDTANNGFLSESDNVQATLSGLGHSVTTFTGFAAADFTAAFSAHQVVLIPELEVADLNASLTPAARTVIANEVAGGKRLVVHGHNVRDNFLMNAVFGLSLSDGTIFGAGEAIAQTPAAAGTAFAAGPASIAAHSAAFTISTASLPPTYKSIYAIGGNTAVFTNATGSLVYLGWDWLNAAPLGAYGDWALTLDAAVSFPVPEPGCAAMVGMAAMWCVGRSRRRLAAEAVQSV
jgi:hypothetical protein